MQDTFRTLGVMIDMSRNAVMHVSALKKLIPLLAKMGYNTLMLYTEDTYEIDGEPFFGYMRGRYSKEEMKEIDAFAASYGMTVIPCIQTLAHLNAFVRWQTTPLDFNDILLVDEEKTYCLIDKMFASCAECFSSRKIHVGMDEAYMLGRGMHMDLHGYEAIHTIMQRHLKRVLEIAEKYGYEIMIWSDMYFRQWNGGKYYTAGQSVPREIIDSYPQEVIPVYWDYYKTAEEDYAGMLYNHQQISDKTWFAGGIWRWSGMAPYNKFSIQAMKLAIDACKKQGTQDVFFTMWGDDGCECSVYAVLPALYYLSQYAVGITDEKAIKEGFYSLTGIAFEDFIKLDLPNDIVPAGNRPKNPSKYMLYSDCFLDYLDYTAVPGAGERYAEFAKELSDIAASTRKYRWLFDTAAKHCDLMAVKYELGLKTRSAYESGDKQALRKLAMEDYPQVVRRCKAFAASFEKQWMLLNKPHGFDVQHRRLGGVILRTEACRKRILDYVNGRIDRIEELDEPLLPFGEKEGGGNYNKANFFSTTSVV